jgi:hypothetical protein
MCEIADGRLPSPAPMAGNQPKFSAKTFIKMNEPTNAGIEDKIVAVAIEKLSITPLFRPARIPIVSPNTDIKTNEIRTK